VRDGTKERINNGVGSEMAIGKDTWVYQINRTNKTSIKEDIKNLGGTSFAGLLCRDFHSLNEASHHMSYRLFETEREI